LHFIIETKQVRQPCKTNRHFARLRHLLRPQIIRLYRYWETGIQWLSYSPQNLFSLSCLVEHLYWFLYYLETITCKNTTTAMSYLTIVRNMQIESIRRLTKRFPITRDISVNKISARKRYSILQNCWFTPFP